jgi:hypothetical protein
MSRRTFWHFALAVCTASGVAAESPPDLRLEWLEGGAPTPRPPAVRGRAGELVRFDFRLVNVGEGAARSVALATHTTLGPAGAREELRPGPGAGEAMRRSIELELAVGLRELCIDATLVEDDAGGRDPNPEDNRICRAVEVSEATTAASVVRPPSSSIRFAVRTSPPTNPEISS